MSIHSFVQQGMRGVSWEEAKGTFHASSHGREGGGNQYPWPVSNRVVHSWERRRRT